MKEPRIISRPIIGYEGIYLIEPTGKVILVESLQFEECVPDEHGFIELTKNGKKVRHHLGALVMKHFVTNYKTYLPVKQLKTGSDYSVPNLTQNKLFS